MLKKILISFCLLYTLSALANDCLFNETFSTPDSITKYKTKNGKVEHVIENGAGAIKISTEQVNSAVFSIPLNAADIASKTLVFEADIKVENIEKGKHTFNGAKFMMSLLTTNDKIYKGPNLPLGTSKWIHYRSVIAVPKNIKRAVLNIGIENTVGTAYYKNIKISVLGECVDMTSYFNASVVDKVANDGKGGWFDGGAEEYPKRYRDILRKNEYANVPYLLHNKLEEKAVVVLKPKGKEGIGDESLKIVFESPKDAKYLYVLNAVKNRQWGGVGELVITGESGKSQTVKFEYGRDTGKWMGVGGELKNAPVGAAWTGLRYRSSDGLYSTRIKIDDANLGKITSLEFRNAKLPWLIAGISLSEQKILFPSEDRFTLKANKDWQALCGQDEPQPIKAGSALDCSYLWDVKESSDRVIANDKGELAFAKNPNKAIRFQTVAEQGGTFSEQLVSKESTERYVANLRREGYNMVRFHYFDWIVSGKAKTPLHFDEQILDKFDYFIYCLKKNGMYVNFDAMCSRYGYEGGNTWVDDGSKRNYNFDLLFSETARQNWFEGVKTLFTRVNPYTKLSLIDDPILAIVNGKNEQEFGLLGDPYKPEVVRPHWLKFLKNRYNNSLEEYNKAWGTSAKSWDDVAVYTDSQSYIKDAKGRDIALFKSQVELDMWKWFEKSLKEIGYKGLCGNFDMIKSYRYTSIRKEMPIVMMHAYHAHPHRSHGGMTRMSQGSSFMPLNKVFKSCAISKIWKKPLLITEYGHVYWNRYRYEQSFSMGAYAALNGVSAMTVHAGTSSINKIKPIRPFACAADPITEVSEYLTAHMLLRKDVSESKSSVRVDYSTEGAFNDLSIMGGMSTEQSNMALITRISVAPDITLPALKNEFVLNASGASQIKTFAGYSTTDDKANDLATTDKIVGDMKKLGMIPKNNRTSAADGIFESSTGELYLNTKKNFMTVDTPRLQGVCAEAKTKVKLTNLSVHNMTKRGNVSVVSVDGKPLSESKRMVLAIATNAINSDTGFTDETMSVRFNKYEGNVPILVETTRVSFSLKNKNAQNLKLYALNMDGSRRFEIPLNNNADLISGTINTAKQGKKGGVSVFYELVAE